MFTAMLKDKQVSGITYQNYEEVGVMFKRAKRASMLLVSYYC